MLMLILMILILLSIAFVTLLERKVLGLIQIRKGPNKIFVKGVFQPVSDGLKLFLKENLLNLNSNKYLYMLFPYMFFFLMMLFWYMFIFVFFEVFMFSMIYFLLISSMGVYCLFGSGWVSNSKYSLLGSYRSVSQTISYEVSMVFLLMSMFLFLNSVNLNKLESYKSMSLSFFFIWFMFFMWVVVVVAELNRSPFDFSESESELVSGFNIEYGGGKFAFLFLAEYGNIIFLSYLTIEIFLSNFLFIMSLLVILLIIFIRGTYPRYRYDNLMYLNWKIILPFILIYYFNLIFFNMFL